MIIIIFLFFAKQCEAVPGGQRFGGPFLTYFQLSRLSASKCLVLNVKDWF